MNLYVNTQEVSVKIIGDSLTDNSQKNTNNYYYGDSPEKPRAAVVPTFDQEEIEGWVINGHPHEVAEILIGLMKRFCGQNKPKEALLPYYCAYVAGWVRRPDFAHFTSACPGLSLSKASYSDYLPTTGNGKYDQNEIDHMTDAIWCQLDEKMKAN